MTGVQTCALPISEEQLAAFGKRIQDETAVVQQFDQATTEPPPS